MSTMAVPQARTGGMTSDERFVILASSLGTVFEWYDFYLYGSLASIIGAQFFSAYPPATRDIFALLAFAAGFLVRPFGAIVFGRVGDIVGRKYTFLVTILIMGLSTFIVGLLPNAATIGFAAPVILIALRLAQGLAKVRLLFPKRDVDFGEDIPAADFLGVLIGRHARIGIQRGPVAQ